MILIYVNNVIKHTNDNVPSVQHIKEACHLHSKEKNYITVNLW